MYIHIYNMYILYMCIYTHTHTHIRFFLVLTSFKIPESYKTFHLYLSLASLFNF